jgi:D-amino-acid dehydrogenase
VKGKVAGGLRLFGQETGDAHVFTQWLVATAEQQDVRFRYGTTVHKLLAEGDRLVGVQVDGSEVLTADAYVAAMGSYTPRLVKPIGIHLPIYPLMGYSSTMPIVNADAAPVSTVMDETYKIGITGFDDWLRVGGTAELAGFSQHLRAPRRATLEHSGTDLFPQGGNIKQASFWTGLRPMTPTTRRWWAQSGTGTCTPTPIMAPSDGTWPVAQDGP